MLNLKFLGFTYIVNCSYDIYLKVYIKGIFKHFYKSFWVGARDVTAGLAQ